MTSTKSAIATAGFAPGADRRTLSGWFIATLCVAAWTVLWAWSGTPYGRFLVHEGWTDSGLFAAICRVAPQGDLLVPAALHALAWVLMIAAMMLPTTMPLLDTFQRIVAGRADSGRLTALVVLGYFIAWMGFGLLAHGADAGLHWLAGQYTAFAVYSWAVGAAVLALAGWFQFSALKYRCLEQCHAPFGFIASRWHGRDPSREAFRLGLSHGLFCVGCCWALMLVMFAVGIGSIGWMLVLAAVMAAEKNLSWGRRLRTPLGLGLIGWAGAIVWVNA